MVSREDGQSVAVTVMFTPGQRKVIHITGVVAEVAEGSAVIVTEDGRRVVVEFGLNGNTPEPGSVVTIVGRKDSDTGVLRARSVRRLDQTLKRLNAHIEEIGEASLERKAQIKHVARVQRLLEGISTRQLQLVNDLLEQLPEAARPALDQALRNLEEANEAAGRALDRALELAAHQEREKEDIEAHRLPKNVKPTLDDIAKALDLTPDLLTERLSQGSTLAQIVEETGFSKETFQERVVTIVLERLQALVDEGRLTPEARELIAAELQSRAGKLIERIFTEDDEARPDLPFSLEDMAAILEMEPSRVYALLREGNSIQRIAERRNLSAEELVERLLKLARERVRTLLEDGHIRQQDAERLIADVREKIVKRIHESPNAGQGSLQPRPNRGEVERSAPETAANRRDVPFDLRLVARILGMSEEALITRLREGGTLSEVAEQSGVGLEEMVDRLTTAMKKKLAEMVESGKIEPDRARKLLEEARERLIKSLREFRHSTGEEAEERRPALSPSTQLYQGLPLTVEDVAGALDISIRELQEWLHEENGIRELLGERDVDLEDFVNKLMNVAEERLSDLVSKGEVSRDKATHLLAKLKHQLFGDLRLTRQARPAVSDEESSTRQVSFVPFTIGIVARSLGLSPHELRQALSSGHTVAEIAEERDISLEKVIDALMHPLEEQVREAIRSGRVSQEETREKLEAARKSFSRALRSFRAQDQHEVRPTARPTERPASRPGSTPPFNVNIVARVLGTGPDELRSLIDQGHTIAAIAKRKGISLEGVVKALLAPVQEELRQAVRNGRIDEENAKKKLEGAREDIIKALETFVAAHDNSSRPAEGHPLDSEEASDRQEASHEEEQRRAELDRREQESHEERQGDSQEQSEPELQQESEVVVNRAPVAHVGSDRTVALGEPVVLNGAESLDDGSIASFNWRQIRGPSVHLSDPSSVTLTFVPSDAGIYAFTLVVTDDQGLTSEPVRVRITVEDTSRNQETSTEGTSSPTDDTSNTVSTTTEPSTSHDDSLATDAPSDQEEDHI